MKTSNKYYSLIKDKKFKIDDSVNGFSGFVQPGSGYAIGCIDYNEEATIYITNTGSTKLKFHLSANGSVDHQTEYLLVQPGELINIKPDKIKIQIKNTLNVSNLHPEKEGSFTVLIREEYDCKPV